MRLSSIQKALRINMLLFPSDFKCGAEWVCYENQKEYDVSAQYAIQIHFRDKINSINIIY